MYDAEIRDAIYIPIASFVTSYARYKTITTSQKIKDYSLKKYKIDKYVYSDTDSIHCLFDTDDELKKIVEIDDYKLGAWKKESVFTRGRYLRQKCYIEEEEITKEDYEKILEKDKNANIYKIEDRYYFLNTTVAGLPKRLGKLINFENFEIGFTTENIETENKKLTYKHVDGGVLLVDTDFSIK